MKISKQKLKQIIYEECGYANMREEMGMPMMPGMVNGEIDEEGRMAKQQLKDIAEYAAELSQMLQDETQLEAWVQAKLTKAADYIKTVKHYVEYGMEEGAYDQVIPSVDVAVAAPMTPATGYKQFDIESDDEEYEY